MKIQGAVTLPDSGIRNTHSELTVIRSAVVPDRVFLALLFLTLLLGGCAPLNQHQPPQSKLLARAKEEYREARRHRSELPVAANHYLEAAEEAWSAAKDPVHQEAAKIVYNNSTAELTTLLRASNHGQFWKIGQIQTDHYRLTLQPLKGTNTWINGCFTSFIPAKEINKRHLRTSIQNDGFGGALVGIRKTTPLEPFMPKVGNVAPITATLSFHGTDVSLSLNDPTVQSTAWINGVSKPLAADFTAPIAYLPRRNELISGLMGLIDVQTTLSQCGLYMAQPFQSNKIPLIFVHGLISTPQMWFNVTNEIAADPELRKHYQCWAFNYPTGNPLAYSAFRLRQELIKIKRRYPQTHELVLVGHSMGGLVSRMQSTTTGRALWDKAFKSHASELYARLPSNNLIKQGLIFDANPDVKRIVFICTPHRGSQLAISSIGALAIRLIHLPTQLIKTVTDSLGNALDVIGGKTNLPTSIQSLSPTSPTLLALDQRPILAPFHSIIGDRRRNDTPNSSDGVVPYWSSHLQAAQSECIVPGPHGSCELPQTIDELKRILRLHLDGSQKSPVMKSLLNPP